MKYNIINWVKENKLIIILFLISTSFFIYQHHTNLSWDFSSYVLNAEYWFQNGNYFEPLRPPLMPFIIGIFSFLGSRTAEFIFIILTSLLLFYSSIKLAKSLNFNETAFYAISLNFYLLGKGLINGTELLSLAFLELFVAFLIQNKSISGLFLGLSAVSRYTALVLFPLIILHLKIKKVVKSLIIFTIPILIWLIYNYYKFGNLFTSIADQYANNILFREYLRQQIKLIDFIFTINILIPFLITGIIVSIYYITKKIKENNKLLQKIESLKVEIIFFILLIFSLYNYINTPIKDARYLFTILLPAFYFSYLALDFIVNKLNKKEILVKAALIIFTISIILLLIPTPLTIRESTSHYYSAIEKIEELNLTHCSIKTNSWVFINYISDKSTSPLPRYEIVNKTIKEKHILVMFKNVGEPEYIKNITFINSLPIIYNNSDYHIIGENNCTEETKFEESYLEQTQKALIETRNITINIDPCFILFGKNKLPEKACNLINLNGFKTSENRESAI